LENQLAALFAKGYTERHPAVRKLRAQMAVQSSRVMEPAATEVAAAAEVAPAPTVPAAAAPAVPRTAQPANTMNPVLQTQIRQLDAEISKHRQEQQRLSKQIANYHAKLEAIPLREQQIVDLVRDYEISKAHYGQLLNSLNNAETATQLEIRQKGEKFSVLDPAQPAERPSSPNRALLNGGGCLAGLGLGILLALLTEFMGMSITSSEQIVEATGIPVLEVIPVIQTFTDRVVRRRRIIIAMASIVALTVLASGAAILIHYRT
jgi:uncharacterized protein involved in exopolysaccharide biosynthesis